MTAGRTRALERRGSDPRSKSITGVSPVEKQGQACPELAEQDAHATVDRLLTHAPMVPPVLVFLLAAVAAATADSARSAPMEQTLAAVRECMAKSPPPWPEAWQKEYVDTMGEVIASHQDASQYAARLQIIRQGFPPYWEGLKKGREQSLFEVHRAEIRWYVESLMGGELAGEAEKQKLRDQWRALMDDSAAALVTQFPFLDPNVVQKAKAVYLTKCYRDIEAPLLPNLRHSFSEEQIAQLKERWTNLRYARVDLWRQLGGGTATRGPKAQVSRADAHPDYLLTQRSLDQLRGQLWTITAQAPGYYRSAVAQEFEARKQRLQSMSEARSQEERLGMPVLQTEYISFLLTALLETAEIQQGVAPDGERNNVP